MNQRNLRHIFHSLDSGFDNSFVTCKSSVGIGAEHQDFLTAHIHLSPLFAIDLTEIRIEIAGYHLLRQIIFCQSFL